MPNTKTAYTADSEGAACIDNEYHWRLIDARTPRGVKMQLINKATGVATYGHLGSENWFTHWAALPTFKKA
jgi:hypothetical protein